MKKVFRVMELHTKTIDRISTRVEYDTTSIYGFNGREDNETLEEAIQSIKDCGYSQQEYTIMVVILRE